MRSKLVSPYDTPNTWFVYIVRAKGLAMKVGFAADPLNRLSALQTGSPAKLFVYGAYRIYEETVARTVERRVQDVLTQMGLALHGEWFQDKPTKAKRVLKDELHRVGAPLHWITPDGKFKVDKYTKVGKPKLSGLPWHGRPGRAHQIC